MVERVCYTKELENIISLLKFAWPSFDGSMASVICDIPIILNTFLFSIATLMIHSNIVYYFRAYQKNISKVYNHLWYVLSCCFCRIIIAKSSLCNPDYYLAYKINGVTIQKLQSLQIDEGIGLEILVMNIIITFIFAGFTLYPLLRSRIFSVYYAKEYYDALKATLSFSQVKIHDDLLKEIRKSTEILQKIVKGERGKNEEEGMIEISKNAKKYARLILELTQSKF